MPCLDVGWQAKDAGVEVTGAPHALEMVAFPIASDAGLKGTRGRGLRYLGRCQREIRCRMVSWGRGPWRWREGWAVSCGWAAVFCDCSIVLHGIHGSS